MKRLIFTAVLLVVMAACCVPVYAEGDVDLRFYNEIKENDPDLLAALDGEYVYSVSGTSETGGRFIFTLTVVCDGGKVTSMTTTDEYECKPNVINDNGEWTITDIPYGDYLIRNVGRPDKAKLYEIRADMGQVYDCSYENVSIYARITKSWPDVHFKYKYKHEPPLITADTGVLRPNAGMDDAQVLFFGGESWLVIAYESLRGDSRPFETNGDLVYPEKSVTFLKLNVTDADKVEFNKTTTLHDWSNCYGWLYDSEGNIIEPKAPSTLRKFIENRYTGDNGSFSEAEQSAIIPKELEGTAGADQNMIRGDSVKDAIVWPLSFMEAWMLSSSTLRTKYDWWLRTPGEGGYNAQFTDGQNFSSEGTAVTDTDVCARPAFNLDENAVVMTSAAVNGKKSGDEGPDALAEVEKKENSEWKVTVKSKEFDGFKVDSVESCNGENLFVEYSGARVSGEGNCFISAVIMNGSDVKYYGRIKNLKAVKDMAGGVLINLKGKVDKAAGDKVYVFNESFNGDREYKKDGETVLAEARTDYVSDLIEVPIPPESECEHDYKDATCTEPKTCVRCGATDGKPLGHKFGDWEVTKEPEPNKNGKRQRKCSICGKTESETIAASGKLLAKMTSKGKNSLVITWNKISGAAGYEVYFAKCNHKSKKNICKKVKTVEAGKKLKYTRKKLKKKTSYKVFVMAYKVVGGSKVYTDTSLTLHTYTTGGNKKYTNPKKVTVKKSSYTIAAGKTAKIKAKAVKKNKTKKLANHTAQIRYISSNNDVATVSKKGIIKAKKKGSCKIYAVASTGAKKTVKVKVR